MTHMEQTRHERFNEAYKYLYDRGFVLTQRDLAEKMKASIPNISSALNGAESILTDKFLRRFNDAFFNVFSEEWLLYGKGKMIPLRPSKDRIRREKTLQRLSYACRLLLANGIIDAMEDLATKMNLSLNALSYILTNTYERNYFCLSDDFLSRFNAAVGNPFNLEWLKNGTGNILQNSDTSDEQTKIVIKPTTARMPIVKNPFGDVQVRVLDIPDMYGIELNFPTLEDCTYAINMPDTSMEPTIKSGQTLLLREQEKKNLEWGKIYLVQTNDSWYVRRLYPLNSVGNKNGVNCISENPHYPPMEIDLEDDKVQLYLVKGWICKEI